MIKVCLVLLATGCVAGGDDAETGETAQAVAGNCSAARMLNPRSNDSIVGTVGTSLPLQVTPTCSEGVVAEVQFRVRPLGSNVWTPLSGSGNPSAWTPPSAGRWYVLAAVRAPGVTKWEVLSAQVAFNVIVAPNRAPVAGDDAATIQKNSVLALDVLANDSDPDGDPLTVEITQPAHGSATLAGSLVTYTPAFDYVGPDIINYTIADGKGGTASAKLEIGVASPASSCTVSVTPASSSVPLNAPVQLVASATCDGPAIEYQWYRRLDGSTVEVVQPWDAAESYGAPTSAVGTNTFFALARTAGAQGQSATTTVTVFEGTGKCTAVTLTTPNKLTVGVAGEPMTLAATATCPADPELQFRVRKFPSTIWINLPGTASSTSWTPSSAGSWYVLAAARTEHATAWIHSYQIRFNVIDGNRAPNANDDAATTNEDVAVSIALGANDSDPDDDKLAFAITSNPAHGTLDASDPANPIYTPNANFFGSDSFTYSVSDGHGGSDTATVSITVESQNDAPVANDDSLTVLEDLAGSVDVTANDSDVDGKLSISSASDGSFGTVTFSGGTATYTPAANFHGSDQFTVTVTDGTTIASSTVFVTVSPVADPPVASDDSSTVDEDSGVWIGVLANDSDDDGEGLSISSVGTAAHGAVTFSAEQVHYAPEANFHGSDSFTYTMIDTSGATGTATVVVAVTSINDKPVAESDSATVDEDRSVIIDAVANDTDVDGDHLAITGQSGASHGSVSITDNKLVYTPDANFHGSESLYYTIEDPQSGFASAMVSITVSSVNDAPVASNQTTVIGSTKNLTLAASDLDLDALTYAIVDAPAHGTLSDAAGNRIRYTREAGYTGDDSFTFTANDGTADSNVATVSITVVEPTVGANIDAGHYHTCSVRTDATLWCWGYNGYGQLGSGNTEEQPIPLQVGSEAVWNTVATGGHHTCATKLDGSLWCWGGDWDGQLGNGASHDTSVPAQVEGSDYTTVAAGYTHTCAMKTDGTLWCWGRNYDGAVGNEDLTVFQTPIQVGESADWETIAAGNYQTCATQTDNTLWCWGANWIGQAGLDTGVHSTGTPTQIGIETSWSKVDANGDHSCALRQDDSLWCWGHNGNGELGDASYDSKWTPVRVGDEGVEWASMGLGTYHTCATRTDDSLWCWGRNAEGSLGDGSNANRNVPGQVGTDTSWSSATGGEVHSCGVKDGVTLCWGSNSNRQLGTATSYRERSPKTVPIGSVAKVDAGENHTCAIRADGSLWCWGHNGHGQLGTGTTGETAAPGPVGSDSWKTVSTGWYHSCAIKSDDSLWCWGHGGHGELGTGDGASYTAPTSVAPGTTWQRVEANGIHTCAIKSDDTLWCWGYNDHGQLGDGTYDYRYAPVQIGTDTWSSIATQYHHSCAIKSDETLWCWGHNGWGNLGDGTYNNTATPVQVPGSWATVAIGHHHTCATQSDDTLWCWGYGGHGALGNGTYNGVASPQRVGTDTDWVATDAANYHSCARKSDDTLWCWGGDWEGQLGLGRRETQLTPAALDGTWTDVGLGSQHGCGVRADQTLACWGYNWHGQLGLPGYAGTYLPTPIVDAPAGLLSYYTGEYNANDGLGQRHGSLSGDAGYANGVRNNGFMFGGNGQFTASAAGLPSGNAARTVMAWVRVDAAAATEAFFAGYGSFSGDAAFSLSANSALGASFSSGSNSTVGGLLRLGRWHHVAATSSGTTATLFVDGVEVASGTHALATADDQSLLFGMLDNDHRLQGAMDEIRIYDRALTVEQMQVLHSIDD